MWKCNLKIQKLTKYNERSTAILVENEQGQILTGCFPFTAMMSEKNITEI